MKVVGSRSQGKKADTVIIPRDQALIVDAESNRDESLVSGTMFDTWMVLGPGELRYHHGKTKCG